MENSLYRAVWRWHFYAGLVILPFLVWLAVTGGLYLYKPEIERAVYRDWIELGAPSEPMPVDLMIRRVEQTTGGRATQVIRPAARDESWRMTLDANAGSRTAFIDPASGDVLGATSEGGVMNTIRDLHGLVITGPIGNAMIEIVAGWTIILCVTGFYLWWPRGAHRALALRGRPRERRFWRDFHASAGALAGAVILFLAVTGMPWSVFWGANLQKLVANYEVGRPQAPGPQPWEREGHGHHGGESHRDSLPWAMQAAQPPHAHGTHDIGPQRILGLAERRGLAPPYTLNLPRHARAPYSVSRTPERASEARLIYVEPATGRVLQDVSYQEFGPGARAIEWGIYTHQGQTYGEINRLIMLAGCIGVVLLAISAPILWWKRRRSGRLEPPPRSADPKRARGFVALMLVLGAIYPLTGATMLLAWAADALLGKRAKASGA